MSKQICETKGKNLQQEIHNDQARVEEYIEKRWQKKKKIGSPFTYVKPQEPNKNLSTSSSSADTASTSASSTITVPDIVHRGVEEDGL